MTTEEILKRPSKAAVFNLFLVGHMHDRMAVDVTPCIHKWCPSAMSKD